MMVTSIISYKIFQRMCLTMSRQKPRFIFRSSSLVFMHTKPIHHRWHQPYSSNSIRHPKIINLIHFYEFTLLYVVCLSRFLWVLYWPIKIYYITFHNFYISEYLIKSQFLSDSKRNKIIYLQTIKNT